MSQNKEDLKNKIIYRASYRGTKEMDILLTTFVKKHIDSFDKSLCGLRITIPGKDNSFKKLLIASKEYLKK